MDPINTSMLIGIQLHILNLEKLLINSERHRVGILSNFEYENYLSNFDKSLDAMIAYTSKVNDELCDKIGKE